MRKKKLEWKVTENGCWEVTSHPKDKDGYAVMTMYGQQVRVHRYIYEELFGAISQHMVVMHKCDNPSCIRPEHLQEGTHKENQLDCRAKGRYKGGRRRK